jgi:hypothetical protein
MSSEIYRSKLCEFNCMVISDGTMGHVPVSHLFPNAPIAREGTET